MVKSGRRNGSGVGGPVTIAQYNGHMFNIPAMFVRHIRARDQLLPTRRETLFSRDRCPFSDSHVPSRTVPDGDNSHSHSGTTFPLTLGCGLQSLITSPQVSVHPGHFSQHVIYIIASVSPFFIDIDIHTGNIQLEIRSRLLWERYNISLSYINGSQREVQLHHVYPL